MLPQLRRPWAHTLPLPCPRAADQPCDKVMAGVAANTTLLVSVATQRIYSYAVNGLTYSKASAACAALSFPGLTGRAYPVSYGS
jgi:hypothetical protein